MQFSDKHIAFINSSRFKLNISRNTETDALPLAEAEANAEANALADPQLPEGIDQTQFVMGLAAAVESASGGSGGGSGCSCKKKKRKSCSEC